MESEIVKEFLQERDFKIGDFVEVMDNAVGTVWRFGRIVHINTVKQAAVIGYGSKKTPSDFLLYGQLVFEPLSHLKRVIE